MEFTIFAKPTWFGGKFYGKLIKSSLLITIANIFANILAMKSRLFLKLLVICSLLTTSSLSMGACFGDKQSGKNYSVYVVPQLAPAHLFSHWAPFLEELGKRTKLCFDLVIPHDIPEFESALNSGTPDFAFMNPYHLVITQKKEKYIPLIADAKNKLDGILVIKAQSSIEKIQDLQNKSVAFPAPNAFAASLLVRAILDKKGVKINPVYVKSHENVYRSVILGQTQAGGGVNNTFEREPEEIQQQIKVLMKTPSFSPHPFSANPRVFPKIRREIIAGFLDIYADESKRDLLYEIQITVPEEVTYRRNYLGLESLGLEKFVVRGDK